MTPIEAIEWLLKRSRRVKLGDNQFIAIVNLIRRLVRERHELQKEVAHLQDMLSPKPKPQKHGTEGNGTWDLPTS